MTIMFFSYWLGVFSVSILIPSVLEVVGTQCVTTDEKSTGEAEAVLLKYYSAVLCCPIAYRNVNRKIK